MDADHETLLSHTAVSWLLKSSMLARVYKLRKEMELYLEAHRNQNLLHLFAADGFQLTLAYLVDIFGVLNLLNRQLQGCHTSRIDYYDPIRAFIEKIKLWF